MIRSSDIPFILTRSRKNLSAGIGSLLPPAKKSRILSLFLLFFLCVGNVSAEEGDASAGKELWAHLPSSSKTIEGRGAIARFDDSADRRVLRLEVPALNVALGETPEPRRGIAWVSLPPPAGGWKLASRESVEATVENSGSKSAEVTLWVVSADGWAAVGNSASVEPGQSKALRCDMREAFPDGTPKIDPDRIREIRIMVQRTDTAELAVSGLIASGTAAEWVRPSGRIDVPDMVEGEAAPGRRVRYQLDGDKENGIYGALYLPPDWEPGKRYPVIAEYPGNIFFNAKACWSTGRPEQCQMGYGISSGTGAIWISLPFVDRENGTIAEAGFGSKTGDDTAAYAVKVIEDICANWGGDRENIVLCGFSRGAIACGYIGLRNDRIAGLWKGFVACQHYDGSSWRESRMEDAIGRAPRFQGEAIFQVDNTDMKANYEQLMGHTDPAVEWTWVSSGLGAHATAMFLDDRPSTQQVREWFRELVETSDP